LLFLIYLNDLESTVKSRLSFFADDAKLMRVVNSREEVALLQYDLDSMGEWTKKWEMSFNIDKCLVMHFGHGNLKAEYTLHDHCIKSTDRIKDLGVTICDSLKFSLHCSQVAKRANQMLGFIKSSVSCRNREIILLLYRALVRPHLEYAVQLWSPYFVRDIANIERIQRRATKLVEGMQGKSCQDRLNELGMYTLEKRRKRGDLIETFKVIKGKDIVKDFYEMDNNIRTRGQDLKLLKSRSNLLLRYYFLNQRVINDWNGLPNELGTISTIREFKTFIDRVTPLCSMD